MKKLLRTIGRFFAGIGRFFQSCGKALAQTLRKPKWRHGGFGTALVCGFIAVCVLLNVAVKSLEDSYGWKLDFSFNGYTSTGAETQKVIKVQENQMGSPTSAKELAKVIYRLLEKDAYGLYHAVCGGLCSRYEFARRIMELAGKNTEITAGDEDAENGRPSYAVLDNLMLRLDDIELPVSWEEALRAYMNKMRR